jgi:hypothetical protein
MGDRRGAYRVLVGRPDGKRPLERPSRRWKDIIKMYLSDLRLGSMDSIVLVQDRDRHLALVNAFTFRFHKMWGS